jgi:hypothetical protein
MTGKKTFKGGWKTMLNGSRVPVTEDEAEDLWKCVEEGQKRRAERYPETLDALTAFIDADQRLTDLGWKKYSFGLEEGVELAVIEKGSTGIFEGFWQKPYFHYADYVASVGKVLWKPVADLTASERARMDKCSADHAIFMEGQLKSLASIYEVVGNGQPMPPAPEGGE